MRIDGRLEARHFVGDSIAVGLVTPIGYVDVVLQPKGFESGYPALLEHAVQITVGGREVLVGSLSDLIESKQKLGERRTSFTFPNSVGGRPNSAWMCPLLNCHRRDATVRGTAGTTSGSDKANRPPPLVCVNATAWTSVVALEG
jgi:hypothetical protein